MIRTGRMRLRHGLRAPAAGVRGCIRTNGICPSLGPTRHEHPELGGDHIEPFGHVFADPGHLAAAARALRAGGFDHPFDPGQMQRQVRRQVAAIALGLTGRFRPRAPQCRLGLVPHAASSTPWASSASSSGKLNWSGDSFSERLPNFSRCAVREAYLPAAGWPLALRRAPPRPAPGGLSAGRFLGRDWRYPYDGVNHNTPHSTSKNRGILKNLANHPAASGRRARSGRTSRQSFVGQTVPRTVS